MKKFREGRFLLIHDSSSRENETDMVIAAETVGPDHVAKMRTEGGGLICVAVHPRIARNLELPYLVEVYEAAKGKFGILEHARADDIPYDERSAFSIAVNHRKTFTGITDHDRALTIKELGKLGAKAMKGPAAVDFGKAFRTPGHVPLLRAADGLLKEREGHTELVVALAEMAGKTPVVAICEMLDARTKKALSPEKAERVAGKLGAVFIEGSEIAERWGKEVAK